MPVATRSLRLIALALLLGTGLVHAKSKTPEARLELAPTATAQEFAAQRESIESAIADKEAYAELRAEDRRMVVTSLDQIAARLAASESVQALPADQQTALAAEQAEVNQILERAHADSRLVCTREKEMGSNFRRNVCLTVAQRRRNADQARGMVRSGDAG